MTAVNGADGLDALPVARRRPALCRLSRRGMGRARIRRPGAVREARARRLPGGALVDHHPAQAPGLPRGLRRLRPEQDRALERQEEGGADAGRRHRAQPRQDRGDGRRSPASISTSRRRAASPGISGASSTDARSTTRGRSLERHSGRDRGLARHRQGLARARRQFRRADHHLRLHAGDRHGQRPSRRLLPPRGLPGAGARASSA